MKILKQGDQRGIIQYFGKCKVCGCEFLTEEADIIYFKGKNNQDAWVFCPNQRCTCGPGEIVYLSVKDSSID